ncbi:hypothetical protein P1X14_21195 [Sphingomonas sp. AOB5]|uniref:hypothetical protein n=1 Tax=Sphingomonas sp. AOB5 TaxID=3034017 RepID=UPI0023F9B7A7|nr:hypothetical protein [Sphingomonas sp. AOB5]MDF7777785.1 hypothetical protein [Sphingomonas sp. AOB5]
MKRLVAAAILLCLAAVPANAMTVAEFLGKVHALKARGILALGSPDIQLLRDEVARIRTAYRADLAAAQKAGRKPHSCPPPASQAMSQDEFIAELEKIPVSQRGISMRTAFYAIMKRRYPCR